MASLFSEATAYRFDYHDAPIRQSDSRRYVEDNRYWVHTEYFNSKIGKTIRCIDYCVDSRHYSVNLHIWYPDALNHNEIFMFAPYRKNDLDARIKALIKRGFSHEDAFKLDDVYCYAIDNCQLTSETLCPLLFFCTGDLGTCAGDYTAMCEKLASKGYVVVALENTHENRLTINDIEYAYLAMRTYNTTTEDMFYNQMDFARAGIIGHLHGGSLAYTMCTQNDRFKAGISLDGMPFITDKAYCDNDVPFMIMFSEEMHNDTETYNVPNAHLYQQYVPIAVTIPKLKRNGFSDLAILKDLPPYKDNKQLLDLEALAGTVEGEKTITLINTYIVDFFAKNL